NGTSLLSCELTNSWASLSANHEEANLSGLHFYGSNQYVLYLHNGYTGYSAGAESFLFGYHLANSPMTIPHERRYSRNIESFLFVTRWDEVWGSYTQYHRYSGTSLF